MRFKAESVDLTALSQQYRDLAAELMQVVHVGGLPLKVEPSTHGSFRGYDGTQFYVVQQGSLTARYQGKTIYTLEEGDILLPDIAGNSDTAIAVEYSSETGATLQGFPGLDFMQRVFDDSQAVRLWTKLLVTYTGLMLRIAAASAQEEPPSTPGFEEYAPGDIIIRQGERADYVFNMSAGAAEVLVNDVLVGRISEGEIFGAMAALTQSDRSATVRAITDCSIVKVPKEQFTELIKIKPATIHSLLIDMANSIVNLNEQLVGLQGETD